MTTWLTKNFSLEELTATTHRGIDNSLPSRLLPALTDTAMRLERMRALLGARPILISSGYRCLDLNLEVGGAVTSAHMKARAADFICPGFGPPLAVCHALAGFKAAGLLAFDQVIEEGTWVHISFDTRLRGQILTKAGDGYQSGLPA